MRKKGAEFSYLCCCRGEVTRKVGRSDGGKGVHMMHALLVLYRAKGEGMDDTHV